MHARAGDYRTFGNGLYFYSAKELKEIMLQFVPLFPRKRVGFIICSNDAVDQSEYSGCELFPSPKEAVSDLYTLASCDFIIGPPSTFTQWASFIGKVPRFVVNHKAEKHHSCPLTPVTLEALHLHIAGFGKHAISEPWLGKKK